MNDRQMSPRFQFAANFRGTSRHFNEVKRLERVAASRNKRRARAVKPTFSVRVILPESVSRFLISTTELENCAMLQ
jgi:hypothetical protein